MESANEPISNGTMLALFDGFRRPCNSAKMMLLESHQVCLSPNGEKLVKQWQA